MKILVFSDSHGYYNRILRIIEKHENVDMCIHCGDIVSDCTALEALIDKDIKLFYVRGNNDSGSSVPTELETEICGKKIFITHGHTYGVKSGTDTLRKKIKEGADLVLYGHTHIPDTMYFGGGILLNPGAICHMSKCTYGVVTIENGTIKTSIELHT